MISCTVKMSQYISTSIEAIAVILEGRVMSQRSGLNQGCKRDMNRMNASSKIRVCCEQEKN